MRLYKIEASWPDPKDPDHRATVTHSGIVGENDAQAVIKAQVRHQNAGHRLIGAQFKVINSRLILCPAELLVRDAA